MPPSEASAPGSIGKNSPWSRKCSLSSLRVTPGSTTQSRSCAVTCKTRFMSRKSIDTPPKGALTWPSSEVPVANGMIATRCGAQIRPRPCRPVAACGNTTAPGGSLALQDAVLAVFDRTVDEVFELLECGVDYVKTRKHSCYSAEVHVRYLRELHADDAVQVTWQLLDYDAKRMHYFEQLLHAGEGWLSATSENMSLHVDMEAGKTAPFPAHVAERLAAMKAAHAHLPRPEGVGRRIAMPQASPGASRKHAP